MRIDELDEFQGVTPQLVTGWLLANGWTQTKPRWWERGEDGFLFDSETFDQQWFWTHALAAIYTSGNVQALLSKINPRMRKGMPSKAARDAHPLGLWLALPEFECIGAVVTIVVSLPPDDDDFAVWHPEGFAFSDTKPKRPEQWAFWPCDEHGNKVRWPTDSQGNML